MMAMIKSGSMSLPGVWVGGYQLVIGGDPAFLSGTVRAKPASIDVLGTHRTHAVRAPRASHALRLAMYLARHLYPPALLSRQRVGSMSLKQLLSKSSAGESPYLSKDV